MFSESEIYIHYLDVFLEVLALKESKDNFATTHMSWVFFVSYSRAVFPFCIMSEILSSEEKVGPGRMSMDGMLDNKGRYLQKFDYLSSVYFDLNS